MKKSIVISTIVAIHAAIAGVLLSQGCSSAKEAKQPPSAKTSVEQVTTISSDDKAVSEAPETKVAEGSQTLRAAPTKPTWSAEDLKSQSADGAAKTSQLNDDAAAVEPMKIEPKAEKKADAKAGGETSVYVVKKGDSLSKIAAKLGVSSSKIMALNSLKNPNAIRVGQELKIPADAKRADAEAPKAEAEATAPAPVSVGEDAAVYVVKKGDSLSKIAAQNDMSVAQLMQINGLKNANIRIGQKLAVKKSAGKKAAAEPAAAQKKAAEPAQKQAAAADGEISHKVKAGEFLGMIAAKYGVKVSDIKKRNNISDPRKIRAGQTIIIPANGAKAQEKPKAEKPEAAPQAEAAQLQPAQSAAPQQQLQPQPAQQPAPVIVPEKPAAAQPQNKKADEAIEVTEL